MEMKEYEDIVFDRIGEEGAALLTAMTCLKRSGILTEDRLKEDPEKYRNFTACLHDYVCCELMNTGEYLHQEKNRQPAEEKLMTAEKIRSIAEKHILGNLPVILRERADKRITLIQRICGQEALAEVFDTLNENQICSEKKLKESCEEEACRLIHLLMRMYICRIILCTRSGGNNVARLVKLKSKSVDRQDVISDIEIRMASKMDAILLQPSKSLMNGYLMQLGNRQITTMMRDLDLVKKQLPEGFHMSSTDEILKTKTDDDEDLTLKDTIADPKQTAENMELGMRLKKWKKLTRENLIESFQVFSGCSDQMFVSLCVQMDMTHDEIVSVVMDEKFKKAVLNVMQQVMGKYKITVADMRPCFGCCPLKKEMFCAETGDRKVVSNRVSHLKDQARRRLSRHDLLITELPEI